MIGKTANDIMWHTTYFARVSPGFVRCVAWGLEYLLPTSVVREWMLADKKKEYLDILDNSFCRLLEKTYPSVSANTRAGL